MHTRRHSTLVMRTELRWLCCACALWMGLYSSAAMPQTALHVTLVMSGSGHPYQAFQQAFHDSLSGRAPSVELEVIGLTDNNRLDKTAMARLPRANLIVAVGTRATAAITDLRSRPPALSVLVPHVSFRAIVDNANARHPPAAIFLDQPAARYLAVARILLPDLHTVGVVYGPSSMMERANIDRAVTDAKLAVHSATMGTEGIDSPLDALQAVLDGSQVLIALPDPAIYNRYSIQGILLTTFRHRLPVVGYSASMLRAGSTAAVFSNPEQIARQAAEDLGIILRQKGRYQRYPRYYHVRFNQAVARSLNLAVPDESNAKRLMHSLEGSDARTPGNP